MPQLPDPSRAFDHENDFYLSCAPSRIAKALAHFELYQRIRGLPGAVVECGVFKGASLARFAIFRQLLANTEAQRIIGFDIFGPFPETAYSADVARRQQFVDSAGSEGITVEQMKTVLAHKGVDANVELVAGDICQTVPAYVKQHPELRISLLNLDTDIYEPAVTILEHLFPRIVSGGILIVDDYAVFPGETKAVDDYFSGRNVTIEKLPYCKTPCFIVKR